MRDYVPEEELPKQFQGLTPKSNGIHTSGNKELLTHKDMPFVAIIGSREASEEALKLAGDLGQTLAENGIGVISGLAAGIDTAGHKGCLRGQGKTIACLGTGFNKIFPPENRGLCQQIVNADGLLLSEYEKDEQVRSYQLINRNRLIIAFSDAVIPVTTAIQGGTVYGCRDSLRYNKPLFIPEAVGGSGGGILLNRPSSELPELMKKQFKIKKSEESLLSNKPLAQPLDNDYQNLIELLKS